MGQGTGPERVGQPDLGPQTWSQWMVSKGVGRGWHLGLWAGKWQGCESFTDIGAGVAG